MRRSGRRGSKFTPLVEKYGVWNDCVNTDEFSIRSVVTSALENLYDDYKDYPSYARAFSEFSPLEFTCAAVSELTETLPELAEFKEEIISDIAAADDADDVFRAFRCVKNKSVQLRVLSKLMKKILICNGEKTHFFARKVAEQLPFRDVACFFSLTESETRLLAFFAVWYKTGYFDSLCEDAVKNRPRSDMLRFLATATGLKINEVSEGIRRLRKLEIVRTGRRALPDVSDELEEFIFEYDGSDIAQKFSASLNVKNAFPPESFEVPAQDIRILKSLLSDERGTHILFHGKPGVGKTEFAKALAVAVGKKIFVPERDKEKKNCLNSVNIKAALFAARNAGGIALIDEADDFLETSHHGFSSLFGGSENNKEKGNVNMLLDESDATVIWVTNSVAGIDLSTRRRFAFTLNFPEKFSDRQRRVILDTTMKTNRVPAALGDALFNIVRRYDLSPAGISLSVKNAKIVSRKNSEIVENMERIAESHYMFLNGRTTAPVFLEPDARFDEDLLVTNPPSDAILANIERYRTACENAGKILPLTMLFSGIPGTGKTQLGRYIAKCVGKEVLLKRMSDIKGPYVGQTEQNIAAAFAQARVEGKVLMIDEADSLFVDRSTARYSWESSATNELLAQMENFDGVFICTTNLVENFDCAAMRRFQWKVEFNALEGDSVVRCFLKYFPREKALAENVERELRRMAGLCPGDFKAVQLRLQYEVDLSDDKILAALRTELDYKQIQTSAPKKIIGFC